MTERVCQLLQCLARSQAEFFSLNMTLTLILKRALETSGRRSITCMAALVHHEDVGANADHSTDVTLELPIGHPGGSCEHDVRMVSFSVHSDRFRLLVRTALFYPLSSLVFGATIWVFIAVQLHFDGVGYTGVTNTTQPQQFEGAAVSVWEGSQPKCKSLAPSY